MAFLTVFLKSIPIVYAMYNVCNAKFIFKGSCQESISTELFHISPP